MEISDFTKERLEQCRNMINPYIHCTPVMNSRLLDDLSGAELFFKCENFQRAGSYKIRGATHALLNLTEDELAAGVITHSSGNFAQALALAAREVGTEAHIVMPDAAPKIKKDGAASYGATIHLCKPTLEDREREANRLVTELGAVFIHPSNNPSVILGQGTAAAELLEECKTLDNIITPIGGGGLVGGTGFACSIMAPECLVYGAEPEEADDAHRSFYSGEIQTNETANTIADGLRTHLGSHTFPLIRQHLKDIILVSEEEIIRAMKLLWERMKIVVEPSSAVALAAVIKSMDKFESSRTGIVLSGGNVDLGNLPF